MMYTISIIKWSDICTNKIFIEPFVGMEVGWEVGKGEGRDVGCGVVGAAVGTVVGTAVGTTNQRYKQNQINNVYEANVIALQSHEDGYLWE